MNKRSRNRKGQMIVVFGLGIAILVLLVIGLYSFEVTRLESARNQLRSATEAAALAGAATLASSDYTDTTSSQQHALNTALQMFQQNNVAGAALTSATFAGSSSQVPAPNAACLYAEFLDPNNNNAVVPLGSASGKVLRLTSTFNLPPAFATFLPLPNAPLQASALGGVPDLDIVVCFDVSGSIDDQTPVTFVKRQWQSANSKNIYTVTSTTGGSPAGTLAQGTIFDILGPPATGTRVNGTYPEYLGLANSGNTYPLTFSPSLRGSPDKGSAPGNYPPGNASTGTNQTFTDMVVNIDGKSVFGGLTTADGYNFPDVATLVEASRGNLDDQISFAQSKASTGVPSTVLPKAGYQSKYFSMAATNLHPLWDAQDAAQVFFNVINNDTDAHFGLITFSDNAGTSANGTYSADKIDSSYGAGGSLQVPIPNISLNSTPTATNFTAVTGVLPTLVATTSTNIGDAVTKAVNQLQTQSRPGSKKAILLFTDGQPTAGGSDPWAYARQSAVLAKNAGIPIYCIGLAQNAAIIPSEISILNDTNSSPTSGGMAAIAGNGGQFFLVTNTSQLRKTFERVARSLVQLVR